MPGSVCSLWFILNPAEPEPRVAAHEKRTLELLNRRKQSEQRIPAPFPQLPPVEPSPSFVFGNEGGTQESGNRELSVSSVPEFHINWLGV